VHYLNVEARDDGGRGNRNSVEVVLVVADANDNAPVFRSPSSYVAYLPENSLAFDVSQSYTESPQLLLRNRYTGATAYSLFTSQYERVIVSETFSLTMRAPVDERHILLAGAAGRPGGGRGRGAECGR